MLFSSRSRPIVLSATSSDKNCLLLSICKVLYEPEWLSLVGSDNSSKKKEFFRNRIRVFPQEISYSYRIVRRSDPMIAGHYQSALTVAIVIDHRIG